MKKLIFLIATFLALGVLSAQTTDKPIIKKSIYYGKSKPICDMDVVLPGPHPEKQEVVLNFHSTGKDDVKHMNTKSVTTKPELQRYQGSIKGKGPLLNFEGVDNVNGCFPADPNGDVSENYYMQTVNRSFAVWDKSGNLIYGPVDNKSLWEALPGTMVFCKLERSGF